MNEKNSGCGSCKWYVEEYDTYVTVCTRQGCFKFGGDVYDPISGGTNKVLGNCYSLNRKGNCEGFECVEEKDYKSISDPTAWYPFVFSLILLMFCLVVNNFVKSVPAVTSVYFICAIAIGISAYFGWHEGKNIKITKEDED
jgi:hypothetical protein